MIVEWMGTRTKHRKAQFGYIALHSKYAYLEVGEQPLEYVAHLDLPHESALSRADAHLLHALDSNNEFHPQRYHSPTQHTSRSVCCSFLMVMWTSSKLRSPSALGSMNRSSFSMSLEVNLAVHTADQGL